MLKKFFVSLFMLAILCGCTSEMPENVNGNLPVQRSEASQKQSTPNVLVDSLSADSLCEKIKEIKKLPNRDPTDSDPVYEAIMLQGRKAAPCLIEKITDLTPMPDPREAPVWRHYVVGDTAVFILVHIAGDDELLQRMLPPEYRNEWESNGIYAYFNYVSDLENRRELQNWWRNQIEEHDSQH